MFTNPAQFANVTQTLFQFQLETFNTLTAKTIKGVEQVVTLNLDTARSAVVDSLAKAREIGEARDAQALLSDVQAHLPDPQDAVAYNRQLAAIISNIRQEFSSAAEAHLAEARSNLTALIYDVTQHVRPGSENAVEIVKTAIDNAFSGFESVSRATRDAVATVEAEVAKATEKITQPIEAAGAGSKAAETAKAAPAPDQDAPEPLVTAQSSAAQAAPPPATAKPAKSGTAKSGVAKAAASGAGKPATIKTRSASKR